MKLSFIRAMVVIAAAIFCVSHASAETCVDCHKKITPAIVTDWELSKHSKTGVDCATCHGDKHTSAYDVANVRTQSPDVCSPCHANQVTQFKGGKHALAWVAQWAMPTAHWQPMTLMEGKKGCGG